MDTGNSMGNSRDVDSIIMEDKAKHNMGHAARPRKGWKMLGFQPKPRYSSM